MIHSSSSIGRPTPLTPPQRPLGQTPLQKQAPSPPPPSNETKAPSAQPHDENRTKTFEATPMAAVNSAYFKPEKLQPSQPQLLESMAVEESEELEEEGELEEEASGETRVDGPEGEAEALEEGEAPEESGEAEEQTEIEAAKGEEEEETGHDGDFEEEREGEEFEQTEVNFELLYSLIDKVQQAPAYALDPTWSLFLLK